MSLSNVALLGFASDLIGFLSGICLLIPALAIDNVSKTVHEVKTKAPAGSSAHDYIEIADGLVENWSKKNSVLLKGGTFLLVVSFALKSVSYFL
jgi:hypothetical protein